MAFGSNIIPTVFCYIYYIVLIQLYINRCMIVWIAMYSFQYTWVSLIHFNVCVSYQCMHVCACVHAQPARLLCPWISKARVLGMGCHFLLQGMFLTQGSNLGLLHCRQTLYWLSHPRNPLTKTLPGLSGRGSKGNHNLIRSFTSFLFVTQSEVFTTYYQWFSKQIKPRLDFWSPKHSCHNYSEHVRCCSCGWSSIFI